MLHRSVLLVAVALTTVAACGGGGDSSSADTSSPAVTADSVADTVADTTATSVVDTTVASTDAPGDATAECMNGEWSADAAEHQRRIEQLGVALPMTVGPDSESRLTIADGAFVTDSVISLTAAIGEVSLTSSSSAHMEGTFTLEGDIVRAGVTVLENEAGEFVATTPDGVVVSFPMEGLEPPSAVPGFEGSTVTCDDTSLTFDVIGSEFGTITYTRVG